MSKKLLRESREWLAKLRFDHNLSADDMDSINRLIVEIDDRLKPRKPNPPTESATRLAHYLIRNLCSDTNTLTSLTATARDIDKLLRAGITEEAIRETIEWLATKNRDAECQFVVLSGASLRNKWGNIMAAMKRSRTVAKREYF